MLAVSVMTTLPRLRGVLLRQSERDDGRVAALDELRVELLEVGRLLGEGVPGRLAQHGLARLGELLEALAQVDGVADERVLDPLLAAEQRGRDRSRC